jgi:hypothetical protein
MAARTRISIAKPDIVALLQKNKQRVFTKSDLDHILRTNRHFWRLTDSMTVTKFIEYLLEATELREERIDFPYRPLIRYSWGNAGTFSIIQSINQDGYFSHYTAMQLHGLTEQIPKAIYFNQEQNATSGGGTLNQASLNNAFRGKVRVTSNFAPFRDRMVYLPTGGNTGQLGVVEVATNEGEQIRSTNIERTLIDATVRPIYSGGIFEVAKAFVRAHDMVSINKLVATLKTLNYTYPYHQTIGFLLQRTGLYKSNQLKLLKDLPIEYKFYLDYGMKDAVYIPEWKLFVPKGF